MRRELTFQIYTIRSGKFHMVIPLIMWEQFKQLIGEYQLILLEDAAIWFGFRHASFLLWYLYQCEGELLSNT